MSEKLGTEKAVERSVHLVVGGEVTTRVELRRGVDVGAAVVGGIVGWVMLEVTMEEEDEMAGGTVVKPALEGVVAGVLTLG